MTNIGQLQQSRRVRLPLLVVAAFVAATPAIACVRVPKVGDVDQALASARLSSSEAVRVRTLRAQIAEQVGRGDYRAAARTEAQAMAIMGLRFEDYGQVVRSGGCNGRWVRRR